MPRKKKPNDYGTGIPYHEVEALARILLPEIQAFFESEEGSGNTPSGKQGTRPNKRTRHNKGGNIYNDAPALAVLTVIC